MKKFAFLVMDEYSDEQVGDNRVKGSAESIPPK
jgi:hypothetical protein